MKQVSQQLQPITSSRFISQVTQPVHEPAPNTWAKNECDSNADTCCLGTNFVVLNYTRRTADVYTYDKSIEPLQNVPIVTGATAYDDPNSGQTFILVINEGLYYGTKLDHTLINPNQIREYGVPLWDNPFDKERNMGIEISGDFHIAFKMKGTKIYFNTRSPTADELSNTENYVHLTGSRAWNPGTVILGETRSSNSDVDRSWLPYVSDADILNSIEPSLIHLTDRFISNVMSKGNYDPNDLPARRTFISTDRHAKIDAINLAEIFGIGFNRAQATLFATTQRGVRSAILPISRRYRADRMYGIKRLNGKFSTDTLYGICKSLRGYVASQIYSHKCGFVVPYHMKAINGENVGTSLGNFIHEYGVPERLTFDGAAIQVGKSTKFMNYIRKHYIDYHVSSPRRPNENPVEGSIREIKKRAYRLKSKYGVPDRLWDFLITYTCETQCLCANSSKYSSARTPLEIITGETPDISEYLDFAFYSWVTFRQNAGLGEIEIGRWLGVSHRVGMMMSYWILPNSGIPISCVTVQKLTYLEQQTDVWKGRMDTFSRRLESKLNARSSLLPSINAPDVHRHILDINGESQEFIDEYNRVIDNSIVPHAEDEVADVVANEESYLNMELGIKQDGESELIHATVKRRAVDVEGRPIGTYNENPLLDSRVYEIEYVDGSLDNMSANIIAENLLSQVDEEGNRQMMIDEIIDHRVDATAIPITNGSYTTKNGLTRKKRTTRGWELCVQWKDGSTDWVQLKDMKESFPIEVAEYSKLANISEEPAFAWWVDHFQKKRDRYIKRVKSKYWQRTHKYGIRIPKSMKEAKEIDDENGNTLWMDAIRLEMKNILVAFTQYDGDLNKQLERI